ncbi:flavin-containing monooxygenase [Fonsecaea pedrosoi]|nr:flavin-containing monooxygenase [Fonsecaea pedrosoi]
MVRVVIVGAGPCGLVALKEMVESGHEAVLFERSGRLGGVFASATAYPNLHLTISNWAMAFSDFPDPTRLHYSTAQEYLSYLDQYARHFDLDRHIRSHAEVRSATLGEDGVWSLEVQIQSLTDSEHFTLCVQADALIVATGSNGLPNTPPACLSGFTGRMIHSSQYDEAFKQEVAAKKMKVLVVGGGESGADLSAELGELSPHVTVWLRRPICVGPRYLNKKDEMEQVAANMTVDFPANSFLEAATTNRMSAAQNVFAYGVFRRLLWCTPVLNRTLSHMSLASTASALLRNDQATYVTKNQRMCEALQGGKIEVLVAPTVSTRGRSCEFHSCAVVDGTSTTQQREFDAVVLCTGFRVEFPWIRLPGNQSLSPNPRSWYLHCFPEGLGHCLFFVGYARPHQGGVPVMAEMLSRYIAQLLRGERDLPPDYAARAQRDAAASRTYYSLSPNLHTLVDYNAFLESVARRIGCEPRLPAACVLLVNLHMATVLLMAVQLCCPTSSPPPLLLSLPLPLPLPLLAMIWAASTAGFFVLHDALLIKWWFYPHWAVWYRRRGPGANPALLDGVLARVNLWKSTAITPGFVLLVLWSIPTYYAQRILSIPLFAINAVLTVLGYRLPPAWVRLLRPKLFALHDCPWRLSDLYLP